jgi:hypothetical protein
MLLAGLVLWGAGPPAASAAARVRRVEAEGVFPIDADERGSAPRNGAVRAAVAAAVESTARALLPPDFEPGGDETDPAGDPEQVLARWLGDVLGDDPLEYATRFRILEDRGVRRARDAAGRSTNEYVVLAEVHVDADRVRERLELVGALTGPSGDDSGERIRIVADGVTSYAAYEALRRAAIDGLGARSVVPLELERGRTVLEVDAVGDPDALLADLAGSAPPELRVVPLEASEGEIHVRIEWSEVPASDGEPSGSP